MNIFCVVKEENQRTAEYHSKVYPPCILSPPAKPSASLSCSQKLQHFLIPWKEIPYLTYLRNFSLTVERVKSRDGAGKPLLKNTIRKEAEQHPITCGSPLPARKEGRPFLFWNSAFGCSTRELAEYPGCRGRHDCSSFPQVPQCSISFVSILSAAGMNDWSSFSARSCTYCMEWR